MEASSESKSKTNEELHKRIKSKLMNEGGEQIFDLLVQHGALTRKELAKHLGVSDTGAYFSYDLQQLKELGHAKKVPGEGRGSKGHLVEKAFVDQAGNSGESTESAKPVAKTES